jgi:hypothetical protein
MPEGPVGLIEFGAPLVMIWVIEAEAAVAPQSLLLVEIGCERSPSNSPHYSPLDGPHSMTQVILGKSRVRESCMPGSVRAKAAWLSYSTIPDPEAIPYEANSTRLASFAGAISARLPVDRQHELRHWAAIAGLGWTGHQAEQRGTGMNMQGHAGARSVGVPRAPYQTGAPLIEPDVRRSVNGELLGRIQTGRRTAHAGSRLKRRRSRKAPLGQRLPAVLGKPAVRNVGGIEETSASFEARSAPRSYPTSIS